MRLFNANKLVIVEVDASDYAIRAYLSQPDLDGKLRPVAYHVKKLDKAQVNHSTLDKELLTIIDSLKY